MKVHRLGFWEQEYSSSSPLSTSSPSSSSSSPPPPPPPNSSSSSSLTLNLKRLRPLAPHKLASSSSSTATAAAFGSSEIITSLCLSSSTKTTTKCISQDHSSPMESTQAGASTRWNPTPEQIKVLEALYRGGMRTPNASHIEHITSELGKYGRIEGKNVFYWFQNHKARERQKQKRNELLTLSTNTNLASLSDLKVQFHEEEEEGGGEENMEKEIICNGRCKRKCRSWGSGGHDDQMDLQASGNEESDCTLELFPLHPERSIQMGS